MPTITTRGAISAMGFGFAKVQLSVNPAHFIYAYGFTTSAPSRPYDGTRASGVFLDSSDNIYTVGYNYTYGTSNSYAGIGEVITKAGVQSYQLQYLKANSTGAINLNNVINISGNTYAVGSELSNNTGAIISYNSSGTVTAQKYYNSGANTYQNAGYVGLENVGGNLLTTGGSNYQSPLEVVIFNSSLSIVTKLTVSGAGYSGCCCISGGFSTNALSNIVSGVAWVYGYGYAYNGSSFVYGLTLLKLNVTSTSISYASAAYTLSSYGVAYNTNAVYYDGTSVYFVSLVSSTTVDLLKMSSSGTVTWRRRIVISSGTLDFSCVTVDSLGNVYVAFKGYYSSALNAVYLLKYNSTGTLQWQRSIVGSVDQTVPFVGSLNVNSVGDLVLAFSAYYNAAGGGYNAVIMQIPSDGSLTGVYTVGSYETFTYAASSLTTSSLAGTMTDTSGLYTGGSIGTITLSSISSTTGSSSMPNAVVFM